MTDNAVYPEGRTPGDGTCLACGRSVKAGYLMCWPDWRKVPRGQQRAVYAALDAFDANAITLGELREVQIACLGWTGITDG